jgi:hypothetical protein
MDILPWIGFFLGIIIIVSRLLIKNKDKPSFYPSQVQSERGGSIEQGPQNFSIYNDPGSFENIRIRSWENRW